MLTPGNFQGKTFSLEVIQNTDWPDVVPILNEHGGKEIGKAMLDMSESSLDFVYILNEDIEKEGWSASMDVTFDKDTLEITEITNLDHIALTHNPTVDAAKMRLSEDKKMAENKEFDDLKQLVEDYRLELSEIKKKMEEQKPPEKTEQVGIEKLELSLGDEPSISDIVRFGLDAGVL